MCSSNVAASEEVVILFPITKLSEPVLKLLAVWCPINTLLSPSTLYPA